MIIILVIFSFILFFLVFFKYSQVEFSAQMGVPIKDYEPIGDFENIEID